MILLKTINVWIICNSLFFLYIPQAFASGYYGDRCSTNPGGHFYFCRGLSDNDIYNIRELFNFPYYDITFTIFALAFIGFFISMLLIMMYIIKQSTNKKTLQT